MEEVDIWWIGLQGRFGICDGVNVLVDPNEQAIRQNPFTYGFGMTLTT